jgi:hypothetical protein
VRPAIDFKIIRLARVRFQFETPGLEEKSSAPVRYRTPVVQSVVRHYTDWATPACMHMYIFWAMQSQTSHTIKKITSHLDEGTEGGSFEVPGQTIRSLL